MENVEDRLFNAIWHDDTAGVRALLAAGADANVQEDGGPAPLHFAVYNGRTECMAALIAGGADVHISDTEGCSPLHVAAFETTAGCVQLLLAAGADPLAATAHGSLPLHYATRNPRCHEAVLPLLLQAAPKAALVKNADNDTPLIRAIRTGNDAAARCLLEQGPLPPAREVLAALASADAQAQLALYTTLVSRQPLTGEEWALVPAPCHGLGTALPAVLQRSAGEAGLLVGRLPLADRQRLWAAALCLARAQRRACASLPSPVVWSILARSAA